jgi:poly(hydroxyalkanoate) granule-associated protein
MAGTISDELKKVWLAGVGAMALTAEKTEELIEKLVKKGEITVEQGKELNEELKRKTREKVKDSISKSKLCVESVIDNLDKMSREDIAAIKAKLAEMEAQDGGKE